MCASHTEYSYRNPRLQQCSKSEQRDFLSDPPYLPPFPPSGALHALLDLINNCSPAAVADLKFKLIFHSRRESVHSRFCGAVATESESQRESERESERLRESQRESQRDSERERERESQRVTESHRESQRERGRERERPTSAAPSHTAHPARTVPSDRSPVADVRSPL